MNITFFLDDSNAASFTVLTTSTNNADPLSDGDAWLEMDQLQKTENNSYLSLELPSVLLAQSVALLNNNSTGIALQEVLMFGYQLDGMFDLYLYAGFAVA